MAASLKQKILILRNEGKTYDEIKAILNCSKATISYHCQRHDLGSKFKVLTELEKNELNDYYKEHSAQETAKHFNISKSTVVKYVDNKNVKLTEEELKVRNYKHVKTHRQKIKEKAIKYKGEKCEKCGYNKCIRALEFHHLDPNKKDFTIGNYKILSWDKIKIELDKCILICSNCHREIHDELDFKTI
jgi:DNA-binding CsgD family transcriptional regulator